MFSLFKLRALLSAFKGFTIFRLGCCCSRDLLDIHGINGKNREQIFA